MMIHYVYVLFMATVPHKKHWRLYKFALQGFFFKLQSTHVPFKKQPVLRLALVALTDTSKLVL